MMSTTAPTPYAELNQVLSEMVNSVQEIMPENFIGAYLQGSFAIGDFDLHSDVDFIIVVEEEPVGDVLHALQAMHERLYRLPPQWAQRLEGSYFPRKILRQHTQQKIPLWYLDNGKRALIKNPHCNTIIVRWAAREKGITLAGPPLNTLIDPISAELLRAAIWQVMTDWGQDILDNPAPYKNQFYQSFIVMNYCRMIHDLKTGTNRSKRDGTAWVKSNLDASWRTLIDRAWAGRGDPAVTSRQPANLEDFDQTLKFVQYIISESKQYVPLINDKL